MAEKVIVKKQKKILIAPLDWGLGHASRCIPIINFLLKENTEIIIAADKRPLALLKKEFSQLEFVKFPGYNITYPTNGAMALKMFFTIPKILWGIYKEHQSIKEIVKNKDIDVIISDNRYGLWFKKIKSIFITHQIRIKAGKGLRFFEPIIYRINKFFISKYDECWIPDIAGSNNLSGELSHNIKLKIPLFYIGFLSRFFDKEISEIKDKEIDVLAILSGPEPQRSIFEEIIIKQLKNTTLKAIIIRGITEKPEEYQINKNLKIINSLNTKDLSEYINNSKQILCRPGYSGLMDLAALKASAILVPTPGQTEQEYLADELMKNKAFFSMNQKSFQLEEALKQSSAFTFLNIKNENSVLMERISSVLN